MRAGVPRAGEGGWLPERAGRLGGLACWEGRGRARRWMLATGVLLVLAGPAVSGAEAARGSGGGAAEGARGSGGLTAEERALAGRWRVLDRVQWERGRKLGGFEIGGLSGAAYEPRSGLLWCVSDGKHWERTVVFRFALGLDGAGKMTVEPHSVLRLAGPPGLDKAFDGEGIALWTRRRMFVSHEGGKGAAFLPGIGCFSQRTGRLLWTLPVPEYFFPTKEVPRRGLQENRGFESLTLAGAKREVLYSANESPLLQDLSNPRMDDSGPVRILRWRLEERERMPEQRAYQADRGGLFGSVVELLAVPGSGSRLLVLERQLLWPVDPKQRRVKIYEVDFDEPGATAVEEMVSLAGRRDVRVLTKRLVFDSARDGLELPDNLEGLTWGPRFGGNPTLVLVGDDNFSASQRTEFVILVPVE